MNSAKEEKSKKSLIAPAISFAIGFFLLGAIGFLSALMDTRGFDKANYNSCLFFFLLFGAAGGLIALSVRPILNWWRKPQNE